MTRRRRPGPVSRNFGPVQTRMFDPGTGWTLRQALHMVEQGYSVQHVAERTGWPAGMLASRAQTKGESAT